MKISFDAGHGKNTSGKRTPDNSLHEWEFNSVVVKYAMKELENYKDVLLLRVDDPTGKTDIPLTSRTNKINAWKSDIHLSIHANAFGSNWNDANGIETFVYKTSLKVTDFAKKVQSELINATGLKDRGVKAGDLHIIRETNMDAILVEHPFMTNKDEAKLLKSDSFRKKCALAIVKALVSHYGLKRKTTSKPAEPKKDNPKKDSKVLHRVQVGAFSDTKNAEKLANELKNKGYSTYIVEG